MAISIILNNRGNAYLVDTLSTVEEVLLRIVLSLGLISISYCVKWSKVRTIHIQEGALLLFSIRRRDVDHLPYG